jgi:uncharacterized repeat protein (TIGR03806 family)
VTRVAHGTRTWTLSSALLASPFGLAGCGTASDVQPLYQPWVGDPGPRPAAYLAFPPDAEQGPVPGSTEAPGFPRWLSETGAFEDVMSLEPASGVLPYEIQAPLWSDGAIKRRWIALPGPSPVAFSEQERWVFPEGTVFIKHFEMAMDERRPEERRPLETRLWIAARADRQYGVTYKWNEAGTDAELLLEQQSEMLSIIDAAGAPRSQPYFYPGARDCMSCHNAQAGFVLGARAPQLNREIVYQEDRPAINQLVAWSGWGLLGEDLDNTQAALSPRLARLDDESASMEQRVRSYWDGNCSMCHAGAAGSVPGWDARFATPLLEQGLTEPPRNQALEGSFLIAPGAPEQSYILTRAATVEQGLRMPPLGRNRVDQAYVDLLTRWIDSMGEPERR